MRSARVGWGGRGTAGGDGGGGSHDSMRRWNSAILVLMLLASLTSASCKAVHRARIPHVAPSTAVSRLQTTTYKSSARTSAITASGNSPWSRTRLYVKYVTMAKPAPAGPNQRVVFFGI